MSTHNLCFEQKYKNIRNFLAENFHFLLVKFSVYLNRRVFAMITLDKQGYQLNLIFLFLHENICYVYS